MSKEISGSSVTVDSSVIISYLLKNEARSREAQEIWNKIILNDIKIINPLITTLEIVSAIVRRTNDIKLAEKIEDEFFNSGVFHFVDLTPQRTIQVIDIIKKTKLKTLDAVFLENCCGIQY